MQIGRHTFKSHRKSQDDRNRMIETEVIARAGGRGRGGLEVPCTRTCPENQCSSWWRRRADGSGGGKCGEGSDAADGRRQDEGKHGIFHEGYAFTQEEKMFGEFVRLHATELGSGDKGGGREL